jgi:ribonucleoside-triphosphate reductase
MPRASAASSPPSWPTGNPAASSPIILTTAAIPAARSDFTPSSSPPSRTPPSSASAPPACPAPCRPTPACPAGSSATSPPSTAADFLGACVHASVLGTIQAAYASLGYLGPVTCALAATDALLGVSICGCLDQPGLLLDPGLLERGARLARAVNQLLAPTLGLTPAARVTCVKPEGTAALLLGTAAGVHPHHARHYFRRVRAPRTLPVYRHFQAANPAMTEPSALAPGTDDVITFPLSAPPGALVRDDVGALAFLGHVRLLRRHWVIPGEAPHPRSPGLHHNVSHTCTVHPEELDAVADFLWDHREEFSGITILGPSTADRFAQPPLQAVVTEADIRRWNHLGCHPVDYSRVPDDPDPAAGIRPPPCTVMGCTAP